MTEWVKVPDYQPPIATECMVCGKEINLGYYTNHLVPMICKECKEAIKYAKKLMNDEISENRRNEMDRENEDFSKLTPMHPETESEMGMPLDGMGSWWYRCPMCHDPLDYRQKECSWCHLKIDWEGR